MNIETLIENQRLKKEVETWRNVDKSNNAVFSKYMKAADSEIDRCRDVKQLVKWQSWTRQVYGAYCRQRDKHRTARNTASMLYIGCLLLAAWIGFREDK